MSNQQQAAKVQDAGAAKADWKVVFNHKWVVKNIPFFLFLSLLAVIYIFNGHFADKLTRKISNSEKKIKEQEYEYKTVKSQVIYFSKASQLATAVEKMGLKPLTQPPAILMSGQQNPAVAAQ
jgi:hypothetical protein